MRLNEPRVEPLEPEDCSVQTMPDVSPTKWHLAHTTWFFEIFVLRRWHPGYRVYHPLYETLFNSYYDTVGPQHPRPRRGHLSPASSRRPDGGTACGSSVRNPEHDDGPDPGT